MSIRLPFALVNMSLPISALFSQNISGKVLDSDNRLIEFANVVLCSLPDSVMIAGTITNAKGEFLLETESNGNGFLQISFIGYITQAVPVLPDQVVILHSETTRMGEVEVKGNLPAIRLKDDALVASVQNSALSKAGTANDVLKRLTSVTDDKGVYSVFGKGEAKIYIDHREMRDVSELDNLSSADIRDVEIVRNPGARYEASVKAVIRINTIRKTGDGFSFDVRSSYWQSQNTDLTEQLNPNYRRNGWDVFTTFTYSLDAWLQDGKLRQSTYVDTLRTQENTLYSDGTSKTLTGIAGVNYEISPQHYAGIKYTISAFPPGGTSTMLAQQHGGCRWRFPR